MVYMYWFKQLLDNHLIVQANKNKQISRIDNNVMELDIYLYQQNLLFISICFLEKETSNENGKKKFNKEAKECLVMAMTTSVCWVGHFWCQIGPFWFEPRIFVSNCAFLRRIRYFFPTSVIIENNCA